MHSSVELNKERQVETNELIARDLRLVKPDESRSASAHFRGATSLCEVAADLLTITSAVALCYLVYDRLGIGKHVQYDGKAVLASAFAFAIVMVLMLDRVGAYRRGNSLLRVRETEQVLRVSAQAFLLSLAVSFFGSILFSRWLLVLCLTLVPLALFVEKTLVYSLIRGFHSRG